MTTPYELEPIIEGTSTNGSAKWGEPQLGMRESTSVEGHLPRSDDIGLPGPPSRPVQVPEAEMRMVALYKAKLATLKMCGFPGTEEQLANKAWDAASEEMRHTRSQIAQMASTPLPPPP